MNEEALSIWNFQKTLQKQFKNIIFSRYVIILIKNPDTTDKFKEINAAYVFLKDNTEQHNKYPEVDYSELIKSATNFIVNKKLSNDYLNEMDITSLEKMKSYVVLYNSLFNGVDELINRINLIIDNKQKQLSEIVLEPTLDDLLNQKVFKLKYEDKEYLVPLWHSIMYFTNENHNLMVKCLPKLPDHIDINDNNDIIVYIKKNIQECLDMKSILIQIGKKQLEISSDKLKVVKKQSYIIENEGIPRINEKKFYIIEEISNVIVNIEFI